MASAAAQQSQPAAQVANIVGQRAAAAGRPLPPEILQEIAKQAKSGAPPQAVKGVAIVNQMRQQQQAPRPAPAPGVGAAPPQGQIPPALLQAMMLHAKGGMGQPPGPGALPPPPGMVPTRPPMPPQGMPPGASAMPPQRPPMPPQGMPPQQAASPALQPRITPPAQNISMGQSPISSPPSPGSSPPNPGIIPFARAAQGGSSPQDNTRLTPSETAMLGRGGDSIVAHLTPGEISIPRELQTPQLLAAIQQAAAAHGISPAQLVAGSKQVSRNPATGMEEHSIWSTILPAVAMAATAWFAPELLPAEYSALGTAAAVGVAGAGATALTGGNLDQSLLTGAIGAVTGGMAGSSAASAAANTAALNGGSEAVDIAGNAIPSSTEAAAGAGGNVAANTLGSSTTTAGSLSPSASATSRTLGNLFGTLDARQAAALQAGLGGALATNLGASLATPPVNQAQANFNSMNPTPVPVNPNYGQLLGSGQTNRPNFANYNPYQAVTGVNPTTGQPAQAGFQFFPQQSATNPNVPAQPNLVNLLQS